MAGSWYPAAAEQLRAAVETDLDAADRASDDTPRAALDLVAIICPHAGLMYSGLVAAHAYRLVRGLAFDLAVLVGPSHHVSFTGVSIWPRGSFDTPLGSLPIDETAASTIMEACPHVHERPAAHVREHSLEMQLPFLAVVAPRLPIVPLVMGYQTRDTAFGLGDCLAATLAGRRALLVASSDLSHFHDAGTAAALDAQVAGDVDGFDADTLMARLERRPEHACGGGPMVAVMRAARVLGATGSRVLTHADSGDVSGDKHSVVGYLSAAIWR
jgi:MEMO1 family protein